MASRGEGRLRSLAKAVSWRVTGTLDTVVVGVVVTGKPSVAGSIAEAELLTKFLLFYCHDRVSTVIAFAKR